MSEFKGTKGKWDYQYTGDENKSEYILKQVETCECCDNKKEHIIGSFKTGRRRIDHDANALLISKAPEMLQELQETLKDLLCIQGSIYASSRIDARWEGAYDIIQKQIDRKKELIKEATEI